MTLSEFIPSVSFFVLGIVASYIFWWIQQHYWIPKIEFSPEIAKYEVPDGKFIYLCAFKNTGMRDIIDLSIVVRIGVKNYKAATEWAYHSIKTNASHIPALGTERRRVVRLFDMREEIEFVDSPSSSLKSAILSCHSLEDIFDLGVDAAVRVHVFGYDEFSGSRKHFCSKPYKKEDIRRGRLNDLDVVKQDRNYKE